MIVRRWMWTCVALMALLTGCTGSQPRGQGRYVQGTQINPQVKLPADDSDADFHFAVVSDRNGGERPGIFPRAMQQLNLLRPDFVMTVGDLIEGNVQQRPFDEQTRELQTLVSPLAMPMFYTPGNHDMPTPAVGALWRKQFGRPYYHFTYRKVLFLVLCSQDPDQRLSAEQVAYAQNVLEQQRDVRWTFVFLHHPLWQAAKAAETNGWAKIQPLLKDRPTTVLVGHTHNYAVTQRNSNTYLCLATTGGWSKATGPPTTQFDHLLWITMTRNGPIIANLMTDGIFGTDVIAEAKARKP